MRRPALRRDRRGVAALEFTVISMFMITLMLAAFDIGNAAYHQITLQQAVRAGAAFAQYYPTNPTGIRNSVVAALPAGWALSNNGGVPAVSCSCAGAQGNFDCSAPPNACTPPMTVSISATMPYTALTPLFNNFIANNTASYVVRFQ